MRKLIVTNIVSLDGHYEGPGANVMALPMDHAFDAHNAEALRTADTLTLTPGEDWADTTEVVARADAHAVITALKEGEGGDILVFGSRTLWNDLLRAGLVDELHLVVGATVLGGGTPLFDEGVAANLQRLGTQTYEGSDNLVVRYAVSR